jgi:hypothetical protein
MLACCASGAATTRPATTQSLEQQLAEHKQQEKRDYLKQIALAPKLQLPHNRTTDLFELYIDKGLLLVHPKIDATENQMRCTIEGIEGPCVINGFKDRAPGGGISGLQFIHRDFSNAQEIFRHTMLFAHAGSVQLSMDLDGLVRSKSVSLIEDLTPDDPDNAVRLTAQVMDALTDDLIGQYSVSAPSFVELRRRYPRETQEFVVPILRDLQQINVLAPDSRITSQVLQTQPLPDEELKKKMDAVLEKFDSDNFQEREKAAEDLTALGQPAAAALMHADRKGWSIERSNGVDAFLAQYKAMPNDETGALRKNPIFLLDCLYSSDEKLRTAAAKLLEPMAKITIDANAAGANRDEMIDRAYRKLYPPLPTTKPTTQP